MSRRVLMVVLSGLAGAVASRPGRPPVGLAQVIAELCRGAQRPRSAQAGRD